MTQDMMTLRALLEKTSDADLRLLVLAERMRFEDEGRGGVWQRLVEEAEASVADDGRED